MLVLWPLVAIVRTKCNLPLGAGEIELGWMEVLLERAAINLCDLTQVTVYQLDRPAYLNILGVVVRLHAKPARHWHQNA